MLKDKIADRLWKMDLLRIVPGEDISWRNLTLFAHGGLTFSQYTILTSLSTSIDNRFKPVELSINILAREMVKLSGAPLEDTGYDS